MKMKNNMSENYLIRVMAGLLLEIQVVLVQHVLIILLLRCNSLCLCISLCPKYLCQQYLCLHLHLLIQTYRCNICYQCNTCHLCNIWHRCNKWHRCKMDLPFHQRLLLILVQVFRTLDLRSQQQYHWIVKKYSVIECYAGNMWGIGKKVPTMLFLMPRVIRLE